MMNDEEKYRARDKLDKECENAVLDKGGIAYGFEVLIAYIIELEARIAELEEPLA